MDRNVVSTPVEKRQTEGEELSLASALPTARRKFLTRGIAGGSVAALVAGKPVKTLAKAYCKFSGWNSVKVKKKKSRGVTLSNAPKTCSVSIKMPPKYYTKKKTKTRSGYTTTYTANFPKHPYNVWNPKVFSTTISSTSTFDNLFGSAPGTVGGQTLLQILSTNGSSVYAYMIVVAFASCASSGFPLSQQYIYNLWQSYGSSNQTALMEFLQQLV